MISVVIDFRSPDEARNAGETLVKKKIVGNTVWSYVKPHGFA